MSSECQSYSFIHCLPGGPTVEASCIQEATWQRYALTSAVALMMAMLSSETALVRDRSLRSMMVQHLASGELSSTCRSVARPQHPHHHMGAQAYITRVFFVWL